MKTFPVAAWAKRLATCCIAVMIAAVLSAASGVQTARACNTPVYRYAMYNWPAVPYRIFYYHHGQPAEEDAAVNRTLGELASGEPAANVLLQPVDVSNAEQFEQYPKPVIDAWRAHGSDAATMHVVFSPWAAQLFSGRLEAATVEAMVDSPARKRLGELLHQGNVVVWLILTGTDAAANQQAEKVANEVVAEAAANKVATEGDMGVAAPPAQPPPGEDAPASQGLKVAVLKVSRNDPAEKWLVRSLLAIEPDLETLTAEPMVFGVYGRGRAMPPCVGKGITAENLIGCLEFLSGPCSCMIKDENPGADLLMRWDWEATAEALAADDEEMGGGPPGYREAVAGGPGGSLMTASGDGSASAAASADSPPAADVAAPAVAAQDDVAASPAETQEASTPAESPRDAASGSFAVRLAWKIGLGLAAGGIVVLAAGMLLLRLQRSGN